MKKWLIDGAIEWTKSYIMDYYDLAWSLYNLTFGDIYDWVKSLWKRAADFVSNPLATLEWFVDQLEEIKERILTMDWYEWWKSTTFVWSNVWLNSIDPASNITAGLWAWMVVKVNKYVGKLWLVSLSKKIDWFSSKFTSEWKYINWQLPITESPAGKIAELMWYERKWKWSNIYYYNSKAPAEKKYLSRDIWSSNDSWAHKWWVWKTASTSEIHKSRTWTYNANLTNKLWK